MIQLGQFTFYRSYYEAIQSIKSPKMRCQIYEAMFNYVLNGVEPDYSAMQGIELALFHVNKPHLDSSRRKAINAMSRGKQASPSSQDNPPVDFLQENEALRRKQLSQLLRDYR